jgi:hypothetical protein
MANAATVIDAVRKGKEFKGSRVQEFKGSRVQEFESSRVLEFKRSRVRGSGGQWTQNP